jgi:AcrR family transcriptional regulator
MEGQFISTTSTYKARLRGRKMSKYQKKRLDMIKREKRNLYLLAAVKTFQERGFHNTTVKDITKVAGTSVGNFYLYFDSKEQILQVLVEKVHKVMYAMLSELNKYEIPPEAAIKNIFKTILTLMREQKEIAFIYIEQMAGVSREYLTLHNKMLDDYIAVVEKFLTRGFKYLNILDRNPRITAIGWISSILQAYYWWATTNFQMNIDDFITNLVNFLMFGAVSPAGTYHAFTIPPNASKDK